MYLLTEWEGGMGKYLAWGQDVRTEHPDREPNIFLSGPVFFRFHFLVERGRPGPYAFLVGPYVFFQPYHFDAYNPHTGTFSYGFLRKLFTGQYRSYGKHSYHIRVDNISWPTTANSHCVCSHYVWPLQPLCLASSPDKPKRLQGFYQVFQQGGKWTELLNK